MKNPALRARRLGAVACIVLLLALAAPVMGQDTGGDKPMNDSTTSQIPGAQMTIGEPVTPSVFLGDVRDLPYVPPTEAPLPRLVGPQMSKALIPGEFHEPENAGEQQETTLEPNTMPSPLQNFAGLGKNSACTGGSCGSSWPPDTVGDVGPNHYIQAVNTAVGIYNKTGTQLSAFTFNSLWSGAGTGTVCDTTHRGDPTVIYDQMADRWFVADLAFNGTASPYYECIAVSKTSDPVSGGWYLYAIRADDASHPWLPDYPKMGIWPDGLYMSANMFLMPAGTFQEVRTWAFNRAQMELGAPVNSLIWDAGSTTYYSMLPSNLRGALPPSSTPNYFVSQDLSYYQFDVFKFQVNWSTLSGTFTGPSTVSQSSSYSVPSATVVPQPGTSTLLDTLGFRLMMQAQYRNISGTESLWVVHTVVPSGNTPTGMQWAQINVTGGTIAAAPVQQQIYGGTTYWRWMPSLAVDGAGNMAVGFSIGNASNYPSLAWAGRLSGDTLGTLGQGESTFFAGTASQITTCGSGACTRWGDYSAMTVDPSDDCTFWYTNEYYAAGDTSNWQTRIASFKFPSCTASALEPIGIWDGGGGDNNWSTANNWTRNTVPTSNDNTYFNTSSAKNATINGSYTFNSLNLTSGYAGTITQGTGNVTVYGPYSQAGGTFTGGSGTMTVGSSFSLTGGAFTAPSGNLYVAGNFTNSGTFNHNNGAVRFNGNTTIGGTSTSSFFDLFIESSKSLTAPSANMNVARNWTNNGTFTPGSGTVTLNGSSQSVASNLMYSKTESPALAIPDNGCTNYTESSLAVADSLLVRDINVTINIAHTWDADLDIYLRSPTGIEVVLSTDNGSSGDNYTNTTFDDEASIQITAGAAPFSGSYRPQGALSSFYAANINGTWKLKVCDDASNDTGSISSWSLQVSALTFNNLTINSGSTTTASGDLPISGNLLVNAGGTLDVGTNSITNVGGTVTNNGTLKQTKTVAASGTTSFLTIPTAKYYGVDIAGTGTALGSTVVSISGNQVCSQANGYPVKRCFVINPTTSANSNVTFYYSYAELQSGQTPANLKAWKYNGSSWSQAGSSTTAPSCAANQLNCSVAVTAVSAYAPPTGQPDAAPEASSGPFALKMTSPQAVTLADFSAAQTGDAVLLTWETNSELDNRGFNLYRGLSPGAPDRQLNETLIPSQGPGSPGGFIYTWEDRADLVSGTTYFYWVEDVDMNGTATRHGPVSVDYNAPTALRLLDAGAASALPGAWPVAGAGLLTLLGALAWRKRRLS